MTSPEPGAQMDETSSADETTATLHTGRTLPLVGLGTWRLSGDEGYRAVRTALDAGYRLLDTATQYQNEDVVGRALRDSGIPREKVRVTTKLRPDDVTSDASIRRALQTSLRRLGLDAVDLWLIHWPPDGARPEVWEQLLALRADGLARDVGVSNYSPELVDELVSATGEAPAVNQVRWSPDRYDAMRLAHSRTNGIVLEGYSPFKGTPLDDPTLVAIADAHRVGTAQVIVRWHVEHGMVVIPKSATPERIAANADIGGFRLDADEVARIDALSTRG